MKKKVKSFFILLFLTVIFFSTNIIFAEEINEQNTENITLEKEQEEQKKQALDIINECIKNIKDEIKIINEKIENVKKKEEYINYPAIRLNVDTPFFGFSAMVDHRLKITKDVSTVDIATGYSIKDIINENSMKVPSFSIASITVVTRDVKLDESISLEDANTCVLKLMEYVDQVEGVNEYLDTRINKTFEGYINKQRQENIDDMKKRVKKVSDDLIDLDDKITNMYLLNNDNNNLDNLLKEYNNISSLCYNLKESLKNNLLADEDVLNLQKQVLSLESKFIDFTQNVNSSYEKDIQNIDIEKLLNKVKDDFNKRKDTLKEYIDNSTEKVELKTDEKTEENVEQQTPEQEQNQNENINQENTQNEKSEDSKNYEEVTVYQITSTDTLQYMENIIKRIEEFESKYVIKEENVDDENTESVESAETKEVTENTETTENTDTNNKSNTTLSDEEVEELLKEIVKIYEEFILRENRFYIENTNLLIKDTTSKITTLSKSSTKNIFEEMKYVYLELPEKLDNILNTKDANSNIETNSLTNEIHEELLKIVETNKKVSKLYNDLKEEEEKNS